MESLHLPAAVAIILAYVAGSIPSAYIAGKWAGVDLRTQGSGNLGATNVVRVLGARIGVAVFVVDALKGFLPVLFLPRFVTTTHGEALAIALGVAAIVGHTRPLFLGFGKGGKGVATAAGVFFALAWLPTTIAFGVWLLVFFTSRYVSLASLSGALALPFAFFFTGVPFGDPLFIASIVIALFVFVTHRANIGRLRRGEEHRFVRKTRADRAAAEPHPR